MGKKKPIKDQPDAVVADAQEIEIAGTTYTLRRLAFADTFTVIKIFGRGVGVLADVQSHSLGQVIQVFLAGMTQNESLALGLIAKLLQVDKRELEDPEKFPFDAVPDVMEAIAEGQEIQSFFAKCEKLMNKLPEMQTASREASNS